MQDTVKASTYSEVVSVRCDDTAAGVGGGGDEAYMSREQLAYEC